MAAQPPFTISPALILWLTRPARPLGRRADPSALPGVVISVQSYGDRLNLHPHVHALASRGVWSADGNFEAIPALHALRLMLLFRRHLLKNLLTCGRIGQATLDILDRFHHPGFSAYEGEGVSSSDSAARERLPSYLVNAPFFLARLRYDRHAGVVTYEPRAPLRPHLSSPAAERFSPLDALAALTALIPAKGLQIVRYYGYYSNKARGQRRRQQQCAARITPVALPAPETEPDDFRRHCKRAWARLIRIFWAADPLACPDAAATCASLLQSRHSRPSDSPELRFIDCVIATDSPHHIRCSRRRDYCLAAGANASTYGGNSYAGQVG